jgi:hypothetical protein
VNKLIDAVAASIQAEVAGAGDWKLQRHDPLWRNPKAGKILNIFLGPEYPGEPRWTGGASDVVEVIVEYGEPSQQKVNKLQRVESGEYAANAEARKIREWALNHPDGFERAWKMDWARTDYASEVPREFFVRYARVTLRFEVEVTYG